MADDEEIDAGSSRLVKMLYGPELGEKLAIAVGHDGFPNWRKVLEPAGPVAQCTAIIGSFASHKNEPCYLCGQLIKIGAGSAHELSPECEHILPVTFARWFLDLYRGKPQVLSNTPWLTRALTLEYAWAHKVCNQAKRADSFITQPSTTEGGKYNANVAYDEKATIAMLKRIKKRAENDLKNPIYINDFDKSILQAIANMDAIERAAIIRKTRIDPIIQHVNTENATTAANLTLFARTAAIVDEATLSPHLVKIIREEGPGAAVAAEMYRTNLAAFREKTIKNYPFEDYFQAIVNAKTVHVKDSAALALWKTRAWSALRNEYYAVFDDWFAVSDEKNTHIGYHYATYRWLRVLYDQIPSTVTDSTDISLWTVRCRLYKDIQLTHLILKRSELIFKQKGIPIPPMPEGIVCSKVERVDTAIINRNRLREVFITEEELVKIEEEYKAAESLIKLATQTRKRNNEGFNAANALLTLRADSERPAKKPNVGARRTHRNKKMNHKTLVSKRRPLFSTNP